MEAHRIDPEETVDSVAREARLDRMDEELDAFGDQARQVFGDDTPGLLFKEAEPSGAVVELLAPDFTAWGHSVSHARDNLVAMLRAYAAELEKLPAGSTEVRCDS